MPFIIKNGKYYGSSADGSVDITEEEYNNLLASGQVNPSITYYITDGEIGGESSFNGIIEVTQQEYDALSDEEKNNGAIYAITDSEDLTAKNMAYDGSVTGLGNNVQDAIDNVNDKVDEQNKNFEWKFFKELTQSNPTSTLPTNFNELLVEIVDGNYGWVFNINILKSQLSGGLRDFHTGFYTGDVCACAVARVSLETISTNVVGNAAIGTSKIYYR